MDCRLSFGVGTHFQLSFSFFLHFRKSFVVRQLPVEMVKDHAAADPGEHGAGLLPAFSGPFPDVQSLATAHTDEVLGLWSGLGYYSRAWRNLHACARAVSGAAWWQFPRTAELLQSLPGIGRSTAAAIAFFCFGERVAILDANVKRVLTRGSGLWRRPGSVCQRESLLWALATDLCLHTHSIPPCRVTPRA